MSSLLYLTRSLSHRDSHWTLVQRALSLECDSARKDYKQNVPKEVCDACECQEEQMALQRMFRKAIRTT